MFAVHELGISSKVEEARATRADVAPKGHLPSPWSHRQSKIRAPGGWDELPLLLRWDHATATAVSMSWRICEHLGQCYPDARIQGRQWTEKAQHGASRCVLGIGDERVGGLSGTEQASSVPSAIRLDRTATKLTPRFRRPKWGHWQIARTECAERGASQLQTNHYQKRDSTFTSGPQSTGLQALPPSILTADGNPFEFKALHIRRTLGSSASVVHGPGTRLLS